MDAQIAPRNITQYELLSLVDIAEEMKKYLYELCTLLYPVTNPL